MKTKLIGLIVVVVVLYSLGFRAGHPQDGLSSALGSAKSSVIVYKQSKDFMVGQKVVVIVAGQGLQTGIVKAATQESADVDTKAAFVRVKQEDVLGRLYVVVPYFGSIFSAVGL
jgi:hypothetical protein